MRLGKKLVLATTCVLGLSGGGEAAELFTPFLVISPGNTALSCVVSNVSDHDTTVRIETFNFFGVSDGDSGEIVLPAGETTVASVGVESARCKFHGPEQERRPCTRHRVTNGRRLHEQRRGALIGRPD